MKKEENASVELLATGSEVSLALEAASVLEKEGILASVVSMPCLENFASQEDSYKDEILNLPYEKRVSIEMGSTLLWGRYAKHNIGVDRFGKSGKASDVLADFGFTPEAIANKVKEMVK